MDQNARTADVSHILFVVILLGKGALGALQIATAAAIFFGLLDVLPALAQSIIAVELAEDPNDFLAARIMALLRTLPETDTTFYTYYFAAHGLLHVGVVVALLVGARWAYPAAIVVLSVFVAYQAFEWLAVGGTMLVVLTVIDLVVIYLTLVEWNHSQRRSETGRH